MVFYSAIVHCISTHCAIYISPLIDYFPLQAWTTHAFEFRFIVFATARHTRDHELKISPKYWTQNMLLLSQHSTLLSCCLLIKLQEFGEDAATAINELLGLYGYVGADESKRNELSSKLHHDSCKKIANISQRLLEAQRRSKTSTLSSGESETKINDYSSMSSDKEELSSSRENSKSPPQRLRHNIDGKNGVRIKIIVLKAIKSCRSLGNFSVVVILLACLLLYRVSPIITIIFKNPQNSLLYQLMFKCGWGYSY